MDKLEPDQLEALAMDALQQVKRTPMSGLSRVVSLLVIDKALRKASRLRRTPAKHEAE